VRPSGEPPPVQLAMRPLASFSLRLVCWG
jgi:hypothetical protein